MFDALKNVLCTDVRRENDDRIGEIDSSTFAVLERQWVVGKQVD